jgi:hypothetical protein
MSLTELIERVEKLEGPDSGVDLALAVGIGGFAWERRGPDRREWLYPTGRDWFHRLDHAPRYTASLDAALGLVERVLPGLYMWRVEFDDEPTPYPCEARVFAEGHIEGGASAKTPALTLILAMLRALSDVLERGVDMASLGRADDLGGDALTRTAEGGRE